LFVEFCQIIAQTKTLKSVKIELGKISGDRDELNIAISNGQEILKNAIANAEVGYKIAN